MGVTGLWKLIEESGKPVPVETLENKVLAIDISIWLHQVVKGFQDNKGGNLPNAHLLGLFHRLCKLLYYRVKPVFIFDGGVPQLKRETIAKRSQNRNKLTSEADRIQELILQNLIKDKVVQTALGQDVCEALVSPSKQKPNEKPNKDDIFKLPCLKVENHIDMSNSSCSSYTDTSDADSSYDEKTLRSTYHINLQAVDVTSDHFKNLPADVRHEILTDIKDMRKQSSWARLHELPAGAYDFSGFQMKRLLKRRQVQVSLEEAEQQMEGKCLTMTELETLMSEEGILQASESNAAQRIASDENTRFLLVKDLGKAYEKAQKEAKKELKNEIKAEMMECKIDEENESETSEETGLNYEIELQKAIAMSLEKTQVYKDDDYNENAGAKLNEAQRQELKMSANSLARAYMVEYAGMTDEEIQEMIRDKESLSQSEELQSSFNFQHNDRFVLKGEICTPYKDMPSIKANAQKLTKKSINMDDDVQYISSSSDDSDLEEVVERGDVAKKSFEIIVDPSKPDNIENDDLFSDIFEVDEMKCAEPIASNSSPISRNLTSDELSTELSKESVVDGMDIENPTSKIVQQDGIESDLVISDSAKIPNVDLTEVKDDEKGENVSLYPLSGDKISESQKTKKLAAVDKTNSENNSKSTLQKISSPQHILSPDVNCCKTKEILNKLKDEIGKVQSMTLDAIDISSNSADINAAIIQNQSDEPSHKAILNHFITSEIATQNDDNQTNHNELLETNATNNAVSSNPVYSTPKKDDNLPKAILNSQSNISMPEPVQIKEERDDDEKMSTDVCAININKTPIKSPAKLVEILEYVKQQTAEAANISLDDITPVKNDSFVINDSDDSDVELLSASEQKPLAHSQTTTSEIIEISDDQSNGLKTPDKSEPNQSNVNNLSKSMKSMLENAEDDPNKVSQLPLNKSSEVKKRCSPISSSSEGPSKGAKVAKQLFDDEVETIDKHENKDGAIETVTTTRDIIENAAKALREEKTQSELEDIAVGIRQENKDLELERNRQTRMATSITEKMAAECKQLLRLFGVPYIVAPMEAEAQCAFLDLVNLTDGTITDDSDVWLFGGRTVYKNFFNQKKNVLEFKIESIEKLFNMDRHKLIQLAMLVGSDYTTGIHGIGAVTAIEILANFPITPMKEGEVTEIMSILSSLRKFRDWWQTCKVTKGGERSALRSKLKNVELFEGFPNMNIVEAYLRPTINDSREKFAWGEPDVETIREFAKKKFGWTRAKTDEILQPVLKKLRERKTQMSIKNYFAVKSATSVRELKVSKRVMTAIDRMSGDYVEAPQPPNKKKERKPRKKKEPAQEPIECDLIAEGTSTEITDADVEAAGSEPKQRRTRQVKKVVQAEDDGVFATPAIPKKKTTTRKRSAKAVEDQDADNVGNIASIEKVKPPKLANVLPPKKKVPIIPNPNQPIPQREKDKKEMELKKEKAIEIFKQKKAKGK